MLLVGRIWAGLGNGLVTVSIGAMFNVEMKIAKTCVSSYTALLCISSYSHRQSYSYIKARCTSFKFTY